jgi:hypothetical protein
MAKDAEQLPPSSDAHPPRYFLSVRNNFTVIYTVRIFRLGAIEGDRCRKELRFLQLPLQPHLDQRLIWHILRVGSRHMESRRCCGSRNSDVAALVAPARTWVAPRSLMEPPICLTVQAWAAKSVQFTSATDRTLRFPKPGNSFIGWPPKQLDTGADQTIIGRRSRQFLTRRVPIDASGFSPPAQQAGVYPRPRSAIRSQ